MAIISVGMATNEHNAYFKQGHIDIKITLGLDENLDEVMTEASERARVLLERTPVEKRYPRFSKIKEC